MGGLEGDDPVYLQVLQSSGLPVPDGFAMAASKSMDDDVDAAPDVNDADGVAQGEIIPDASSSVGNAISQQPPSHAIDRWRTPKSLEDFGSKHFGFDIDYEPLEKT